MSLTKAIRFRLRSLMLLVTALSVGFACYASIRRAERLEQESFRQLQARGFTVLHYTEGVFVHAGPVGGLCGTGLVGAYGAMTAPSGFTDQDAASLKHVRTLRSLDLAGLPQDANALALVRQQHPNCYVNR